MGWLIALGVLILIGLLPLGIRASYDVRGALVFLYIGPVRINLYPGKEAEDTGKDDAAASAQVPRKTGGQLSDFFPLIKTAIAFIGELIRKITVKDLRVKVTLAGNDPCDLSINYGRTWAALGNLQPHLNRLFRIRKQNIAVECDYEAEKSVVTAHVKITISLARFLMLVIRYGIRAIKQYMTIYNKRKGGAKS